MVAEEISQDLTAVLDYYKSLTPNNRIVEACVVTKSIENGAVPEIVRYGVMNDTLRGVVKSTKGDLYYFNYAPNADSFRLVKADDDVKLWESYRLLKNCTLGCDLVRMEKAEPASSPAAPALSEDQNIEDQDRLITEVHPGAAVAPTPDLPERGRVWHEEEEEPVIGKSLNNSWDANALLRGLGKSLQSTAPKLDRPISTQEHRFLTEELGRTPKQIEEGDVKMSPTQKVLYNRWLGKSLRSRLENLSGLLGK